MDLLKGTLLRGSISPRVPLILTPTPDCGKPFASGPTAGSLGVGALGLGAMALRLEATESNNVGDSLVEACVS